MNFCKLETAIEGRVITWDDYVREYSFSVEALVVFMFMEQIAQEGIMEMETMPHSSVRETAVARRGRGQG
jgi:hypothetical protein